MGLDPSWQLSLQVAVFQNLVFGRDFAFSYGPLGYLLIPAAANKLFLLLYDLFILGSLISLYRAWLPPRPNPVNAPLLLALALVTKYCLWVSPSTILFIVLCYWLWRSYDKGDAWAIAGTLIASVVLFLGKVNYGLVVVCLVPAYGLGLLVFHRHRRIPGFALLLGFPVLISLASMICRVDLPAYLRFGIQLISGYNEAMSEDVTPLGFRYEVACLLLLTMLMVAGLGWRRLAWRPQIMLLPLVGLATLLLFKNGFTRAETLHTLQFNMALPLIVAVWEIGWRRSRSVRVLLYLSLLPPLVSLTPTMAIYFGRAEMPEIFPQNFAREAFDAPWHENAKDLQKSLHTRYPDSVLPASMLSTIGRSPVDVMPIETSVAILNGLNYQPRPVPQSYSAYTPWLDESNARFLASTNAPAFILYACTPEISIDNRPAAWDESATKRILLENYKFVSECVIPLKSKPNQPLADSKVFLLKHVRNTRELVPVATNHVSLILGQNLPLPETTNLVFLTLRLDRSILGKIKAAAMPPNQITVKFNFANGSSKNLRAILPILSTGVLVNRRVESPEEILNWIQVEAYRNMAVSSISFTSPCPQDFKPPFGGSLIEYRVTAAP